MISSCQHKTGDCDANPPFAPAALSKVLAYQSARHLANSSADEAAAASALVEMSEPRHEASIAPGLTTAPSPTLETDNHAIGRKSLPHVTIVVEIGASHVTAMWMEPGRPWTRVRFKGTGAGVEHRSGYDVIPTLSVVCHAHSGQLKHGQDGLNYLKAHSKALIFRALKMAFVDNAPTKGMREQLDEQRKTAEKLGLDIKDVARAFFSTTLQSVLATVKERRKDGIGKDGTGEDGIGEDGTGEDGTGQDGTGDVWFNMIDNWDNKMAQELMNVFHEILPQRWLVRALDECYSSVCGIASTAEADGLAVVFDCGASTAV